MTTGVSAAEPTSPSLIASADGLLFEYVQEVEAAKERIGRGEFGHLKEAVQVVRDLRIALKLALDERARVAKFSKDEAGIVYDYALDFDAARDEICRRLARLRDAGDSG